MSNNIEMLPPAIIDENDAHMEIVHKKTNEPRFQRGSVEKRRCIYVNQLAHDFVLKIEKRAIFPNGEQTVSIHKKNPNFNDSGYPTWYSITIAHYPYDAYIDTDVLDRIALAINKTMNISRMYHHLPSSDLQKSRDSQLKFCQYELAKLLIEGVTNRSQIDNVERKIPNNVYIDALGNRFMQSFYKLKDDKILLSTRDCTETSPVLLKGKYGADFFFIGDYDHMYKKEKRKKDQSDSGSSEKMG